MKNLKHNFSGEDDYGRFVDLPLTSLPKGKTTYIATQFSQSILDLKFCQFIKIKLFF